MWPLANEQTRASARLLLSLLLLSLESVGVGAGVNAGRTEFSVCWLFVRSLWYDERFQPN
jgi:hypothetical protein